MSLEDNVRKDFYYTVEARMTEFFGNVEDAAKKEKPSDNCDVEIQSIKFNKANIKLNSKADNGMSKEAPKSEGKAE